MTLDRAALRQRLAQHRARLDQMRASLARQASPEFVESVIQYLKAVGSERFRVCKLDPAQDIVSKGDSTGADLQFLCDQIASLQQRVNLSLQQGAAWRRPGPEVMRKQLQDLQLLKTRIIEDDKQISLEQSCARAVANHALSIPENLLLAYIRPSIIQPCQQDYRRRNSA